VISTTRQDPPSTINGIYSIPSLGDWHGLEGKVATWNVYLSVWEGADIISSTTYIPPVDPVPKNGDTYVVPVLNTDLVKWNALSNVWDLIHATDDVYPLLNTWGTYVHIDTTFKSSDSITIEYDLFNIDIESVSTSAIEFRTVVPYSQVESVDSNNKTVNKYYFWVKNKNVKPSPSELSLTELSALIKVPSVPYMFMQGFQPFDNRTGAPARFTQVIVRGISNLISESDRFKIRFQIDESLRDDTDIKDNLTKKNVHTQWETFRQNQPYVINQYLWDKLTESMIGYQIDDSTKLVPTLDRVLYDKLYGSATRIGINEGQSFVDKEMALNTIMREIENSDYNLFPVDKSVFLDTYKFDTPDNILESMSYIYNTFSSADTNRIFFSCLHDAHSLKSQYGDMFKTSTIALHGIRILETTNQVIDG
jgi:hypothetical protein